MTFIRWPHHAVRGPFVVILVIVDTLSSEHVFIRSDRKVKEYMEQFIIRAQDVVQVGIDAAEVFAMSIQCMEVR